MVCFCILNLKLMSRSLWKPNYLHPQVREDSSSVEIFLQNRATVLTSTRVGRRYQISNGIRWFLIEVTSDRVGHRVGEFAPTRKRPIPKKKVKKKLIKLKFISLQLLFI